MRKAKTIVGKNRRMGRQLRMESLESRRVLAVSYVYGIDQNNDLYEVDPVGQTQDLVFAATAPVSGLSNAFAYDRTTAAREFLFFMNGSGSTSGAGQTLYVWNKLTNAQTVVATTAQLGIGVASQQPANAAFYSDSYWFFEEGTANLYKIGLDYTSGTPVFGSKTVYDLSGLTDGAASFPTTANMFGDIAINRTTGVLYASNTDGFFFSLDVNAAAAGTGSPTSYDAIGTSGDGTFGLQLSFNEDYTALFGQHFLGASGDGVWYSINMSDASLTSLGYTSSPGFRDLGGASPTPAVDADLTIEKSDGVSTVFSGDGVTYTYTITVTNLGPDTAEDVSVADTWPAAFTQGSFGTPSTGSVTPGANGSFTWDGFTLAASGVATLTVSYTVPFGTAAGSYDNTAVVTSSTVDPDPSNNTATDTNEVITNVLVAGNDEFCASTPRVYVINPYTGEVVSNFLAYADRVFRGGVRVATGDLNDDGIPEVVVGPGAGRIAEVKVFKLDGTPMPGFTSPYLPFGASYKDGIEINVGDVDGDGKDDLVAAKSSGAGDVQVSLSDGTKFAAYKSFTAFTGLKNYRGGASAAVAGTNTIVVGSGAGTPPTVKTFDIAGAPTQASSFQPAFPKGTVGVSMTTQNFSGTGLDLIASAGRNGKSQVTVYNGQTNTSILSYSTFASQAKSNSPVYAAASALGASRVVDTVFMAQGDGGKGTIKKVNAATGVVDSTFVPMYAGKPLTSPLRINTNLRRAAPIPT